MANLINGKPVPFAVSPNRSNRNGKKPKVIVIHSTEGAFSGAISWLRNPDSKASAHYIVARDGRIVQLVDTSECAWHAGESRFPRAADAKRSAVKSSINNVSVGIECEHFDGHDNHDWPLEQLESVAGICKLLMKKWNIPIENIVGHKDICIPVGRKVDPVNFPWQALRELIEKAV